MDRVTKSTLANENGRGIEEWVTVDARRLIHSIYQKRTSGAKSR